VTDPIIIAEWAINRRDRVRVSIEQFNGTWLVNIRKWFESDDGEIRPGKQGIALGIRHLPQLTEAVNTAVSAANERQLIPAPSASRTVVGKGRT
jgi:hypothetical protein